MFAESEPPMVRRSAPVCFCANAQACPGGACLVGGVHRYLGGLQEGEDLGPLDAGLDLAQAALAVEREHAVQLARVEHQGVGAELLAAHGVASARDAHRRFSLRAEARSGRTASRLVGAAMR